MTAIRWIRLREFRPDAPPCDGACMTNRNARGVSQWRLELLDWPDGYFCGKCKRDMARAYESALGPDPQVDREAGPRMVAA